MLGVDSDVGRTGADEDSTRLTKRQALPPSRPRTSESRQDAGGPLRRLAGAPPRNDHAASTRSLGAACSRIRLVTRETKRPSQEQCLQNSKGDKTPLALRKKELAQVEGIPLCGDTV